VPSHRFERAQRVQRQPATIDLVIAGDGIGSRARYSEVRLSMIAVNIIPAKQSPLLYDNFPRKKSNGAMT